MEHLDFTLHNFLHLRLIDATSKEVATVQRQLGPLASPILSEPDLVIRFIDKMPEDPNLRYIGLNDSAFTANDFIVLKGKNKSRVKVIIPFDQIGQKQVEICCERGINNIPLLIPIINLILLTKGILPFHASAFNIGGKGILVTGWAKGGKTETLLAFMSKGARYVGDEWVYLCPDGTGMFGIPEPMRVWNWHLNSLPHYRARLKRKEKVKLSSLSALSRTLQLAAGSGKRLSLASLAQRIHPIVQRQMFVHFAPHSLFGQDHIQAESTIDKVFFTASHNNEEITVEPIAAEEVARRMVHSLREEQLGLTSYYLKYRFAFPDRPNHWLDQIERIQMKLLIKALKDKEAYVVYHPYPVHIPRLYEAIQPYIK